MQQGNLITDKAISQLHAGMSIDDVRTVLGSPLLNDIYHNDHYVEYVYTMRRGNHPMTQRHLTIYFSNGKLTHYTVTN